MSNNIEIVINDKHIPVKYYHMDDVYYAYKKRKHWVLLKTRITSFSFTNIVNYQLENGWHVWDEERIFTDRDEAIEYCLDRNKKDSVKIYGE